MEMAGRNEVVPELRLEFSEHGVEQVVGRKLITIRDGFDRCQSLGGTVHIGHGDGAVQGDDGRIVHFDEAIVEREDLPPVRRGIIRRGVMARGDARMEMIFADLVARRRPAQMHDAARDHLAIPARAVLFLEAKDVPVAVHARGEARPIQEHEREQRMRAGLIARRVLREQGGQANRLRAKFLAHEALPAGSFVPFVEKQEQRLPHSVEAARQLRAGGNLKGNLLLLDSLPGAREPLGDGGLGRQEGRGDFGGAEAAQRLERQARPANPAE